MHDKIKKYIDEAFEGLKETRQIRTIKEDLYQSLLQKYNNQIEQNGKSEEEAYIITLAEAGNLEELVDKFRNHNEILENSQVIKKRSAHLITYAVVIFILSPMPFITFREYLNQPTLGTLISFLFIAIGVGMLVFNSLTKPKHYRVDDSLIEDFKEWRDKKNRNSLALKSFRSSFWSIVLAVYLISNFLFGIWTFSWIIFIIALAIENIIKGIFYLNTNDSETKTSKNTDKESANEQKS
jgi:uncharacterized membrane protein YciS (DUF1049 family)